MPLRHQKWDVSSPLDVFSVLHTMQNGRHHGICPQNQSFLGKSSERLIWTNKQQRTNETRLMIDRSSRIDGSWLIDPSIWLMIDHQSMTIDRSCATTPPSIRLTMIDHLLMTIDRSCATTPRNHNSDQTMTRTNNDDERTTMTTNEDEQRERTATRMTNQDDDNERRRQRQRRQTTTAAMASVISHRPKKVIPCLNGRTVS